MTMEPLKACRRYSHIFLPETMTVLIKSDKKAVNPQYDSAHTLSHKSWVLVALPVLFSVQRKALPAVSRDTPVSDCFGPSAIRTGSGLVLVTFSTQNPSWSLPVDRH